MHDKPGVIVVDLTLPLDQLKQALDDAYDAAGSPDFTNERIAVFAHGYKQKD